MIDKKTGFVELAFDKIIKPNMLCAEIKKFDIGESQTERDVGNGWTWLDVRNVKIADVYYIFSFAFYHDQLKELSFVFSPTKYDLGKGWESYSEKEERRNAIIFNNWLMAELGAEKKFSWGEVWAGYDEKGSNSDIGIRYKN